jgi:hypothetical protein
MDVKASEVSRAVQDAFKILEDATTSNLVLGLNSFSPQCMFGGLQHPDRGSCSLVSGLRIAGSLTTLVKLCLYKVYFTGAKFPLVLHGKILLHLVSE